jgi:hypothetical protein
MTAPDRAGWRRVDARLWPILALGTVLAWYGARKLQIHWAGWGTGYDVNVYQSYAQQWGTGRAPYLDFQPEYPPGALLIFLVPLLFGGMSEYHHDFSLFMQVFDLAACLLVLGYATYRRPGQWLVPALVVLLYLLVTAALFPVLYMRFDLAPATITAAAVYFAVRKRTAVSSVLLGVAGAVKLWPFALVPLWLGLAFGRGSARKAVACAVWIGVGGLLASALFLPRAGWDVLAFLKYHEARGIQIETTWSTIALLLNKLGVASVHPEHNYGAFHLAGPVASFFSTVSMPMTVLAALLPQVVWFFANRRDPEARERRFAFAALATALGFMIAGKVLSPQFMLWIAPLLPLVAEGPVAAVLAVVMAALTTVVYPYLSPALEQRAPGHGWALLSVGSRNILLIGWYLAMTMRGGGLSLRPRLARAESPVPAKALPSEQAAD